MITIKQRADDGWVITMPNKFEDGWTTTLMSTDQNAPSARRAIALAAVTFAISFGMEIDTQAKDKGHALSMIEHLGKAAKLLEWEL